MTAWQALGVFILGAAAGWFGHVYRAYLKMKAGEWIKKAEAEVKEAISKK